MKQLTTIFLALIILLQTFSRFVVEADYFLNKSFIAKVLCVNKEKPQMQCNGKCYLAKQLKKQEKDEREFPGAKKIKMDLVVFTVVQPVQFVAGNTKSKEEYLPLSSSLPSSLPRSIFHPPSV